MEWFQEPKLEKFWCKLDTVCPSISPSIRPGVCYQLAKTHITRILLDFSIADEHVYYYYYYYYNYYYYYYY